MTSSSTSTSSGGGVSFAGLLAIVFIVLKLVGVIAWSWWWVLAPLWVGAAIALLGVLVFFAVLAIVGVFK